MDNEDTKPDTLRARMRVLESELESMKIDNNLELAEIRKELERMRRLLESIDGELKTP